VTLTASLDGAAIPSEVSAILLGMMGESSAESHEGWTILGRRWLASLVAIFLRTTRDPALAFDLATETLATARTERDEPPDRDDGIIALLQLGAQVLAVAAEHQTVPAVERRRHRQATPLHLTVAEQQAVMRLAEENLDLPPIAQAAADAFARSAPPPTAIRQIRLSGLVEAEPLPDHARWPHDA
jgi:hypothetical protein